MRNTMIVVSSIAFLAFASQASAQPMDLPSGVHDPDALTCDAPQLVSVEKAIGWKLCVQNSMLATLSETGALSPGGPVVRSFAEICRCRATSRGPAIQPR